MGFVEAMGGQIAVEDTPGGGVTMVISLDASRDPAPVVDDEPQILRALGINLRARGYDVDLAPDGEHALDPRRLAPSRRGGASEMFNPRPLSPA